MSRTTNAAGVMMACLGMSMLAAPANAGARYEATITRTSFGMPHIKAKNFGGLGFGAAYAEAQDNICLMADAYVTSSAKRSRFFGADGDTLIALWPGKNIDSDVFFQSVSDIESLRTAFDKRSSELKALVDGWVAGYNQFVSEHADRLPAECAGQPWVRSISRDDVLRSLNGFSMLSSSVSLGSHIATAAPPSAAVSKTAEDGKTAALQEYAEQVSAVAFGSNGWAFGGDATTSGKGLVVGNPHFPWFGSNRFYQMHLTIPGKLDVAGAAIINQPFVGIGFNKDIAWTHTVNTAAHMTLSRLKLDASDPTVYVIDGKGESMVRRHITIENKDGPPIVRTVYSSRHGQIFSMPGTPYEWTHETAYAITDANSANVRSGDSWLGMARARNVRDIRESLARHLGSSFINTLAADRSGDALYTDISAAPNVSAERFASCGTISERMPAQLQRFYVLDGSRSECKWENTPGTAAPGLLPASQMATLYRRDYVQNSNDSYRWTNLKAPMPELGPMVGKDPLSFPDMRTRSGLQEITRVLRAGKIDADLAAKTMFENKNFVAQFALPSVLELCKRNSTPADACAALAKWDGKAEIDSRGSMLFTLFWSKVGTRPDLWTVPFDPADPINTPRSLAIDGEKGDALLTQLAAAADTLGKMGVALDAPLGEIQFAERGDERIPISGGPNGGVLNYTAQRPVKGGFAVFHGASYVQAVTFDDKGPVAKAVLTYSQSTNSASPHYSDQTREFSKKQLHRVPFTDAEIAADAVGTPLTVREKTK